MSKVFRGVKKVFKKVAKVAKKVLPIALAIGALVFTGGAALGLAPMAGGWGAMAAGISAKLGASGVVGAALTGAITQAGYGALIGGTIAKVSGGSFSQGARRGAVVGTVTGGLMGAAGMPTDPFAGIGEGTAPAAAPGVETATGNLLPGEVAAPGGMGPPSMPAGAPAATPGGTATATGAAPQVGTATAQAPGWLERNQTLAGHVVSGLGQGLMARGQAGAEMDMLRERQRLIAANYQGADPGANYQSAAPGGSGMSPTERFDPRVYGQFEYQYNPKTGRIERVRIPTGG